jgi:hypothetical protein
MDEGAAFGFFPQLRPRRRLQDPIASADVPLQVLRGRLAGLLGAPADIGNIVRSPMPMEAFGSYDYEQPKQLPYTTEQFLKELPLAPTAPVGQLAGQAASFVPLNPAPLVRGLQKVGTMVGEGMAERVATGRPMLPSLLAEPPSAMFAVEPNVPRMNLLDTPPETMTSLLEVKPQAPVSDLGFYSAAEQAALNLQRNKGSGQAFLNDLLKAENVKKDELQWMGVDDFLKEKPNVTKQEVQDFIANNRVDVKEVTLGGAQPFDAQRLTALESEYKALKQHPLDEPTFGEDKYDELIRLMNLRDQSTTTSLYDAAEQAMRSGQRAQSQGNRITAEKYFREAELLNTRAEKLDLEGQGMSNPPRYEKYQLPGGENYREILLTLPQKPQPLPEGFNVDAYSVNGVTKYGVYDASGQRYGSGATKDEALQRFSEMHQDKPYKSSHFDEPNILAHIRVNDRVDADGKKMLLIEEIQSDWHQAGREKGYQNKDGKYGEKVSPEEYKRGVNLQNQQRNQAEPLTPSEQAELDDIMGRHMASIPGARVPDAPFKDTWYQLALKRVLKHAADNGYERVGLTTGKQQADRFNLAESFDAMNYKKNKDGTFALGVKPKGEGIFQNDFGGTSLSNIPEKELPSIVGKELAQKIIAGEGRQAGNTNRYILEGIDLQIGGEGMKKYYDEIYPKFLDKYGKKWNARVGETEIKTGNAYAQTKGIPAKETIRYIDITPEMKGAVSKGQPLFAVTPALPLGGLLGEPEKKKELSLLD